MAKFKKEGGTTQETQPKQAHRVVKNPNFESNMNAKHNTTASGSNMHNQVASGAGNFVDTNVMPREGTSMESEFGTYFSPLNSDVSSMEEGAFPPLSTNPVDVVADGKSVNVASKPISVSTTNVTQPISYANATSSTGKKGKANFRPLETENVMEDVELSIPLKVVEEISNRFDNTLYGYFIGKRVAFPVVEYYARTTWAKYSLKKVMMNAKGFFFFKFDTLKGLEDVLEEGP